MEAFGLTDKGKVRSSNQDTFRLREEDGILIAVVCDGMGGTAGGNVASELAADAFMKKAGDRLIDSGYTLEQAASIVKNSLLQAVDEANLAVYKKSVLDSRYSGMGTTLVGAVLINDKIFVVNVGDSRLYSYKEKKLEKITRDHSLVQALIDAGSITEEEAKMHPNKNIILRALGIEERADADFFEADAKGRTFLLCSDGLSNYFDSKFPKKVLDSKDSFEAKAKAMINYAISRGGADNITVLLLKA